jgi:hypothetical protein
MAVIVIATHRDHVLITSGGKWLLNTMRSPPMKERVAKAQRSTAKTSADAYVDLYATRPANTLMTPPVQKVDKETGQPYFTVRYISQAHPNPPGFIKGTFPDSKFKGESPQDAAAREFEEETGYRVPDQHRFREVAAGTNIFKLAVPSELEAALIFRSWTIKLEAGEGELVDLGWVPIKNVRKESLNPESQIAFPYLSSQGGRRVFSGGQHKMAATRSMTRRARRSKSRCVGIKRSAVCKRTEGCKYASGTKRRFCRTAKNRKLMSKGL